MSHLLSVVHEAKHSFLWVPGLRKWLWRVFGRSTKDYFFVSHFDDLFTMIGVGWGSSDLSWVRRRKGKLPILVLCCVSDSPLRIDSFNLSEWSTKPESQSDLIESHWIDSYVKGIWILLANWRANSNNMWDFTPLANSSVCSDIGKTPREVY